MHSHIGRHVLNGGAEFFSSREILHNLVCAAVIAVRRGNATSRVGYSGLPSRRDGRPITGGQVLFEYLQEPLPPPVRPDRQTFRTVAVSGLKSMMVWAGAVGTIGRR